MLSPAVQSDCKKYKTHIAHQLVSAGQPRWCWLLWARAISTIWHDPRLYEKSSWTIFSHISSPLHKFNPLSLFAKTAGKAGSLLSLSHLRLKPRSTLSQQGRFFEQSDKPDYF